MNYPTIINKLFISTTANYRKIPPRTIERCDLLSSQNSNRQTEDKRKLIITILLTITSKDLELTNCTEPQRRREVQTMTVEPQKKTIKVFILLGQSNMVGTFFFPLRIPRYVT